MLRHAREIEEVKHEKSRIMIFPDYTIQVQKARKSYDTVKLKLRSMGLTYMLMFPSKLEVLHAGKAHFFSTPQAAWDWATETPHITCNRRPAWGSTDAPRGEGPGAESPRDGCPRHSRSRRNRRTNKINKTTQSPESKIYTDATDSPETNQLPVDAVDPSNNEAPLLTLIIFFTLPAPEN